MKARSSSRHHLTFDAVAPLEGGVQGDDGVRAVHAPKMRVRASNREQIPLEMDPEDDHHAHPPHHPRPAHERRSP